MNENYNEDDLDYDREYEERRKRRQQRRRRAAIQRTITLVVLFLLVCAAGVFTAIYVLDANPSSSHKPAVMETQTEEVPDTAAVSAEAQTELITEELQTELLQTEAQTAASSTETASLIEEAKRMAMGYDYDGAIALLQTIPAFESVPEVTAAISEFESTKATCVAVDVNTVPHIFYHSLINDTDRAFNVSVLGQGQVDGMNAWMTTVEEFDKITQTLYDNGYVYVRLRDLVVESTDENGNAVFTANTSLMLPPGKKAIVLSIDDLSYYHSYEPAGYPEKMVLDENGKVKCLYTDAQGNQSIGDYDVVPRLNTFLEAHPDGAYKGARGLIAMTGYNGCFGYRTDIDYEVQLKLSEDQRKWLDEHPDFNRQKEIEEATVIADAIKESGWEFASHTWGHLSVTHKSVEELDADNQKWIDNVQNVVGPVDTIIFAHGNDIGDWQDYSSDNEKFQFFKNRGYNYFCNVDGSQPYWVQIRSNYVRQGRINLDGYMLYQSKLGATTVIDNLFLASQVFDNRRPTPVVANGEG